MRMIRIIEVGMILGGLILWLGRVSWFPTYFRPEFMGAIAFFYVFLIELPPLVLRRPVSSHQSQTRQSFQTALAWSLVACSFGSLGLWGLYKDGIPYDKFVHVGLPLFLTVTGIPLFQSWFGWSFRKSAFWIVIIISVGGVGWEYVEAFFSTTFHIGLYGHLFDSDSVWDIISNIIGTVGGVLWLFPKKRRFIP